MENTFCDNWCWEGITKIATCPISQNFVKTRTELKIIIQFSELSDKYFKQNKA